MHRVVVITHGDRYGMFTVLRETDSSTSPSGTLRRMVVAVCECGTEKVVELSELRRGNTKSCGCFHREHARSLGVAKATHGQSRTGLYAVWKQMHQRCSNPNNDRWADYGGRGIRVCAEWRSFDQFLADMGPRPAGLTIERNDNDGNYEPGNCRWATQSEQRRNQRARAKEERHAS